MYRMYVCMLERECVFWGPHLNSQKIIGNSFVLGGAKKARPSQRTCLFVSVQPNLFVCFSSAFSLHPSAFSLHPSSAAA